MPDSHPHLGAIVPPNFNFLTAQRYRSKVIEDFSSGDKNSQHMDRKLSPVEMAHYGILRTYWTK